MLDDKQRHILEAVVQVLAVAGIDPWFEARLIKDSSKKLNGKRISSKSKTDLASVLKIADEKRVNMLPNYRMELRMYATVGASRTVFMGQEMTGNTADTVILDEVRELPKGRPINLKVPLLGVLNVDNPRDPRHQQWGNEPPKFRCNACSRASWDADANGRPCKMTQPDGSECAGKFCPVYESVDSFIQGHANYSPAKNVERLRAEGLAEDDPLMVQAKSKVPDAERFRIGGVSDYERMAGLIMNGAPLAQPRIVADHTCDANGPMRQRDSDGPFLTTCSLCGEFNAGTT